MKLSYNLTKIFADKVSAANIPAIDTERVFASDMNSALSALNAIKAGNIATAVASATSLVLPDGGIYKITGTNQIESIDCTGFEEGMMIGLFFTGVLTVKHGSTVTGNNKQIILQNGDDLVTGQDTFIILQYWNDQFVERMSPRAKWANFTNSVNKTPNSTTTVDRTGTVDFTTFLKPGYGVKYKTGGVFYYALIRTVTATQFTIGGVAMTTGSASIQEIYFCYPDNVLMMDIEINNSDWQAASTSDILNNGYTAHPIMVLSSCLVYAKIWCKQADTGTNKTTINVKNGSNNVFSSVLTYTASKTYYNSGVNANSSNYYFSDWTSLVLEVTSPGNKDTLNAKIELFFILK